MKRKLKKYLIRLFGLGFDKKEWRFIFAAVRNAEACDDIRLGYMQFEDLLNNYIPLFEKCMRQYVKRKRLAYLCKKIITIPLS